jgi:type IV secretory pathway VirB2 component (pilin)
MRHAKPIAILTAAALTLGLPLAVYAQALPEAAATVAPAADPLLTLLGSLGPTGGAGAIVAYVLHSWRTEAARHATERDDLRARLSAIELSWAERKGEIAAVHKMLSDLANRLGDR